MTVLAYYPALALFGALVFYNAFQEWGSVASLFLATAITLIALWRAEKWLRLEKAHLPYLWAADGILLIKPLWMLMVDVFNL